MRRLTNLYCRPWLVAYRVRANLSQEELAEKIGVTNTVISRIESGIGKPSVDVGIRLADVLGFDIHEFIDEKPFEAQ